MNKLALIGGSEIEKYTVADKLWEIISNVTGENFSFDVISIKTRDSLDKFYNDFLQDDNFIGFNIACPWKSMLSKMLTIRNLVSPKIDSINTVYKNKNGTVGINTDVVGVEKSIAKVLGSIILKNILVIGGGGAGLPTAYNLTNRYGANVYIYDIKPLVCKSKTTLNIIDSLFQLSNQKYDLIINATPLGKYYFDSKIESFTSPLDINILSKITHKETVLQEMNYFPGDTLFLQIGKNLGLTCIHGYLMLVFQAIASFEKYFGKKITDSQANSIIDNMVDCISLMEDNVLSIEVK